MRRMLPPGRGTPPRVARRVLQEQRLGNPVTDFEVLQRRGWLSRQPAAFRERFLVLGRRIELARGAPAFVTGDPPGGMFGVLSGGIGVEVGGRRLPPRLGHIHRTGAWFGIAPVLAGSARKMGFHAIEESACLYVPLPQLQRLVQADPDARVRLGELANDGMVMASEAARELLIHDAARRIVAVMLRVTGASEGVQPDDPRGFLLTQHQLAEMSNASRHSAWRALRTLAARGWIEKRYNHVRLVDVAALENFAYEEQ
jgi:CRP-like cAMP-binding protein